MNIDVKFISLADGVQQIIPNSFELMKKLEVGLRENDLPFVILRNSIFVYTVDHSSVVRLINKLEVANS